MNQWCEFKSHRGKNKKLTALKSNSNTVWFNFQTYIYIVHAMQFTIEDYISHLERLECIQFRECTLKHLLWRLTVQIRFTTLFLFRYTNIFIIEKISKMQYFVWLMKWDDEKFKYQFGWQSSYWRSKMCNSDAYP